MCCCLVVRLAASGLLHLYAFAYLIMKCVYLKNVSFIRDDVTIACEKTSWFLYKFEWDEN